ncbi:class I SAM-dependent methyltransferase [Acaryochloris sp. IP29b_bin.137]|uniref:class I SAM-dependent methyltransferase n=1 Tax=Acaryochloris sp. IP29b_bin.137 TaxID=2969217 RepID=UPI0026191F46|nr:class I SAM-dependent methyltransferase [Acaryochloris sp. IP29b_bin.137]
MADLQQQLLNDCYGQDRDTRRHWYSPAATAYQQVRPRYPQALLDQVMEITLLSSSSRLLEIGCGPAIATPAFAQIGCSIMGIEPNPDFFRLAQQTCQPYANVALHHCLFEEWPLEPGQFDAILAASSFHWVTPDIGYPKAAAALRPGGHLILLWNKELQPSADIYSQLSPLYQQYAPTLNRAYEDQATQIAILNDLERMVVKSGHFRAFESGWQVVNVSYSIDQYLLLLSTYSPYLKLEAQQRQNLFQGLRQILEGNGDTVALSYLSAFHIVQPC